MQTIIWAIGTMFVLTLLISFLPLGYTLKGKLLLVLTSFILSLGALAAVSIFPLWQTSLMLLALIFFVAYFMNNRMGTLLFNNDSVFEDEFVEITETPENVYKIESLRDVNLMDNNEDLVLPVSSDINLETAPVITVIEEKIIEGVSEMNDEDISFLLERNTDEDVIVPIEDHKLENGYLSEIESLLEVESAKDHKDLPEEIHNQSPIVLKDIDIDKQEEKHEPLDDSFFDFLLAQKEVAAERDDILEVIEHKEKVSLQK